MKKFLPYILIGMVVMGAIGPLNAQKASAQTTPVVTGERILGDQGMSWANCVPGPGILPSRNFDISKCVAVASYYILYAPTAVILYMAGIILNGAVNYSLDGKIFNPDIISNGWTITRDFANMFFIFVLLYIAIATILQLSGYGMKDLLVKIIIIALLVNFSLLICHVIIDASNILAFEFYNNMTTKADVVTTTLFGENARNISGVFMAGFNPQKLLSTKSFGEWTINGGTFTAVISVLLMFLIGSIMNIVGAFVLFAGAVLFVIRVAVLWLIMLLAPLAFLAMVLPATKQYASEWWNKLFKQAFFAPAFLFLFYLVSKLIAGDERRGIPGIIRTMFDSLSQKTAGLNGLDAFMGSIITIFIFFTVMAVLMIACLIVAQKMGAYGAGTMMKWGQSARGWAQGYAGRVAGRTAIARPARWLAERGKDETGASWAQRLAARSPLLGGAFLRTTQRGAKVGGLDKITEQRVAAGMSLPSEQRAKYLENLGKGIIKGKYGGVDKRSQEEMFKRMSARERVELLEKVPGFKPTYDSLTTKLSAEEREKTEKIQKESERKAFIKGLSELRTTIDDFRNNIKLIKPEEVPDLDKDNKGILKEKAKLDVAIDNFGAAHIKKVLDRGDEVTDLFFTRLAMLGDSVEDVAKELEAVGNRSAAGWVRGGPANASILKSYGMGKTDLTLEERNQKIIEREWRKEQRKK